MVEVNLWSGLTRFTDGIAMLEVEGTTIGEVLDALIAAHPDLKPFIDAGISVAVDGEVIAKNRSTPVRPDSEVYLMQQLKGG